MEVIGQLNQRIKKKKLNFILRALEEMMGINDIKDLKYEAFQIVDKISRRCRVQKIIDDGFFAGLLGVSCEKVCEVVVYYNKCKGFTTRGPIECDGEVYKQKYRSVEDAVKDGWRFYD